MTFDLRAVAPAQWADKACDALLLVVVGQAVPQGLPPALEACLKLAQRRGDLEWKAGRSLQLLAPAGLKAERLQVVVAGSDTAKAVYQAVLSGVSAVKAGGARTLAVCLAGAEATAERAQAVALAAGEALYVYRHTKPSAPPPPKLKAIELWVDPAERAAAAVGWQQGVAIAAGVQSAREHANRPGNHCTPSYLAAEARKLGKAHGLSVQVLGRKEAQALGMGSFLAVAQGSDEPPKMIVARWNGGRKGAAPVVLVGKGITFDSGGISLKPGAEMDEMKFDMGGAASVLGALEALALLKVKVNVVGVIVACENLPSGRAVKPGDVVTSLSGQTIEILNTDAEGRLILCDALTYVERLKPAAVVDIATLTGACMIALGGVRSGLFSPDDVLAAELSAAGDAAIDPCWRMPLDDDYGKALDSNFADMANVGPRAGGAITAAKFLQRFTQKYAWAHLDIAGTAWKSGAAKGATGRPVGLLTHFVLKRAKG